jgi:1-acyl-sn-glycerol-3-phosphate acyltransferase
VTSTGLDHVPERGRAMVVGNHAGSLFPFDAAMIATAMAKRHAAPRWPHFLVLDWALSLPAVGPLIAGCGGVPANPENATELLQRDELVIAFPEGVKGTAKPFADRYRLQPFGHGFIEVALRTGSPIVPVAVVGAEEIYPKLGESESLASLIGAPYVPITPTFPALGPLGLIPLPSRWRIEFCEPIDVSEHSPSAAADAELVAGLAGQVQDLIQRKLHENLVLRGPAF